MKTVSSTKPVTITHSSEEGLINSSQDLGWEYIVFNEYRLAPTQISYPAFPQHNLYLCLATRPYRIHHWMGKQRYVGIYSRGDIGITPAGIASIYRTEGNDHFLQIQIEPQFLHQVAQNTDEIDASTVELIPKFRERNPQIEQIIMMLYWELHQGSGWGSKLYIESLSNALAIKLLRYYSVKKTNLNLHSVGISDRK